MPLSIERKPPLEGIIRTVEDAATNTHPYPILYHPLWFRTLCIACGAIAIAPQRSTLAVALADRIAHERSHHDDHD